MERKEKEKEKRKKKKSKTAKSLKTNNPKTEEKPEIRSSQGQDEDWGEMEDEQFEEVNWDEDNQDEMDWEDDSDLVMDHKEKLQIITLQDIPRLQNEMIANVASVCNLSNNQSALLLIYCKWDANLAIRRFFEENEKICKEAGIIANIDDKEKKKPKKSSVSSSSTSTSKSKSAKNECLVCLNETSRTHSLVCKHGPYCRKCWRSYLEEKLESTTPQVVLQTKCIWPSCTVKVGPEDFDSILHSKAKARYMEFFARSLVDNSNKARWCPSKGCENIVYSNSEGKIKDNFTCTCGCSFCFSCGQEKHSPVTCAILKKWQIKNQSEGENVIWLKANTKPCPKCSVDIEKNAGCMHMTCVMCKHEWCWQCRQSWDTHGQHTGGYFSCNKYQESDAKCKDDEANQWKKKVNRYRHYYERYFNHDVARKKAEEQMPMVKDRMHTMRQSSNRDPEFLLQAQKLIMECRCVLKNTFIMGYYIPETEVTKNLFEFVQANLEGITERLTGMMEKILLEHTEDETQYDNLKNLTRVARQFLDKLVNDVQDPEPSGPGEKWRAALAKAEENNEEP